MKKYISPIYQAEIVDSVDIICTSGLVTFTRGTTTDKSGNTVPIVTANVSFDSLYGNN